MTGVRRSGRGDGEDRGGSGGMGCEGGENCVVFDGAIDAVGGGEGWGGESGCYVVVRGEEVVECEGVQCWDWGGLGLRTGNTWRRAGRQWMYSWW